MNYSLAVSAILKSGAVIVDLNCYILNKYFLWSDWRLLYCSAVFDNDKTAEFSVPLMHRDFIDKCCFDLSFLLLNKGETARLAAQKQCFLYCSSKKPSVL